MGGKKTGSVKKKRAPSMLFKMTLKKSAGYKHGAGPSGRKREEGEEFASFPK